MHHIRALEDLTHKGRKQQPEWAARMAARRRKTLSSAASAMNASNTADVHHGEHDKHRRVGCHGNRARSDLCGSPGGETPPGNPAPVATRYDKRDYIFRGTFDVASIWIWLRDPVT